MYIIIHVIVIRWRRVVYGLYTSGSVFIGHEGVARVVYQNGSHECITRKPQATPSYNWLIIIFALIWARARLLNGSPVV